MSLIQIKGPTIVSDQGSRSFPIVDIGKLTNGGYALSWMGVTPTSLGGGSDVFTVVYGADGQPIPGSSILDVTQSPGSNDYDLQITPLASGRYAVTWLAQLPGAAFEVYTTVYGADGQPIPGIGTSNVTNNGPFLWDHNPRVTALAGGGYALTWYGDAPATGVNGYDIVTAVYTDDGQPVGGTSVVNVSNTTTLRETDVQIAALTNGGYAMVWTAAPIAGGTPEVFTAVYGADGQPVPDSVIISASGLSGGGGSAPEITALADGGYALAWYNNTAVYTAVFSADGQPKPGTGAVNVSGGGGLYPQLAALDGGGFAIVWLGNGVGGNDVFTAVYGPDGQLLAGTTPLNVSNSPGLGEQRPQIAALTNGGYALSWAASGGGSDIYTAAFGADGQPVGTNNVLRVNETSGFQDLDPRITALADGAYALTWYGLPTSPNPSDPTAPVYTAVFQVVTDNVAPTINSDGGGASAIVSLAENTSAVSTVSATDPDAGQTLTYAIASGADAEKFTINAT
ncbi:MAG: cadherin repeat domain-containing protein, partial [Candidatus Zixiibacteriota bacterium]